jgi:uncharacterized protein YjbI with pentapeptide repeats
MAGDRTVSWERCSYDDCVGVRLAATTWCLTHAAEQDPSAVDAELERIGDEGAIDARGVQLSAELLKRILRAAPQEKDHPIFKGDVRFDAAIFKGEARFVGATFERGAWFNGATFMDRVWFFGATFKGDAHFNRATFERDARFGGLPLVFWVGGATFKGDADFNGATFKGDALFDVATFEHDAQFQGATFEHNARFNGATVERDARFDRTTFEQAREIGPVLARQLVLDEAAFRERVQLDVVAAAPAILAGAEPFTGRRLSTKEQDAVREWRLPIGSRAQQGWPRLLSLRRADVAGLRVANVDLQACRFVGAYNLDKLRIEGEPQLTRAPGWWRTRRKTLAEEQHWRASRTGRWRQRGWYPEACKLPASHRAQRPAVLSPAQVAVLYRELRKGREDAKDEPGAADFYYGEMEMRRHTQHEQAQHERRRSHWATWAAARTEHAVVWLYWLVSGYALRAWRALTAFTAVILVAALIFAFWGFPASELRFRPVGIGPDGALVYEQRPAEPPPGVGRLPAALRFSAQSATALLRGPDRVLTPLGEWVAIALRFLGPVLLGLAILSVRGRVRR